MLASARSINQHGVPFRNEAMRLGDQEFICQRWCVKEKTKAARIGKLNLHAPTASKGIPAGRRSITLFRRTVPRRDKRRPSQFSNSSSASWKPAKTARICGLNRFKEGP